MQLGEVYKTLRDKFGDKADPGVWWPIFFSRTDPPEFERVITNVLVSQSQWSNVRPAVEALDRAGLLTVKGLAAADEAVIAAGSKPVGFQKSKAECLKALGTFVVMKYETEAAFCAQVTRDELLGIRGVGPETADRILLYSCRKLAWPVDTYCRRVLAHYGVILLEPPKPTAKEKRALIALIKRTVEEQLPRQLEDWQRLHALMQMEGEDMRRRAKK